ncbi:trigger factor [Rhodobium gokarnense]|uniref:Trigger factor n=1 Tax=Rhodobium gokarnense TaxID=364296 RepID=A0ABT3HAS2_9HYPH|nr:trigger factor [Rhodobium gokarnense]MCW2307485.1 trigger factor [Rhodobium gokarnense]
MQINETLNEGLKRELSVVVPADELDSRLVKYLEDVKDRVRLPGFRPGKVPLAHLKRVYGTEAMKEIVNETITETIRSSIDGKDEKPAFQPDVDVENETLEGVLNGDGDLTFKIKYEVLPEFELGDFKSISIERPVAEVTDEEVEARVRQIAEGNQSYAPREEGAAAEDGDRVTLSYVGKLDGEAFEGGSDENGQIVLGSGRFIPGFEEQIVGVKVGDEKTIKVTFPEDYPAEHLAGKETEFDIVIKEVAAPEEVVLDDAFASRFGIESMDKLNETVKQQIENEFAGESRQKVKRQLLDKLDELHKFELPPTLLQSEFEQIWGQLTNNMEQAKHSFEDEDTTEEKAREEYMTIAERRVRLGLVLSEIGERNEIKVTEEEMQRALYEKVSQFPGQEKQVVEYYQQNPTAMASLRAPIYEDKVIDYLLELAEVEEKTVTKDELFAEDDTKK